MSLPDNWCPVNLDAQGRCACTGTFQFVDCSISTRGDKITFLILTNVLLVLQLIVFATAVVMAFKLIKNSHMSCSRFFCCQKRKNKSLGPNVRFTLRGATIFAILFASLIRVIYFAVDPQHMRGIFNDAANDTLNVIPTLLWTSAFVTLNLFCLVAISRQNSAASLKHGWFWTGVKWLFVLLLVLVWCAILPVRIWASITADSLPRAITSWGTIIAYLICLIVSFAYAIQVCRLLRQQFWKSPSFSKFLKRTAICILTIDAILVVWIAVLVTRMQINTTALANIWFNFAHFFIEFSVYSIILVVITRAQTSKDYSGPTTHQHKGSIQTKATAQDKFPYGITKNGEDPDRHSDFSYSSSGLGNKRGIINGSSSLTNRDDEKEPTESKSTATATAHTTTTTTETETTTSGSEANVTNPNGILLSSNATGTVSNGASHITQSSEKTNEEISQSQFETLDNSNKQSPADTVISIDEVRRTKSQPDVRWPLLMNSQPSHVGRRFSVAPTPQSNTSFGNSNFSNLSTIMTASQLSQSQPLPFASFQNQQNSMLPFPYANGHSNHLGNQFYSNPNTNELESQNEHVQQSERLQQKVLFENSFVSNVNEAHSPKKTRNSNMSKSNKAIITQGNSPRIH